MKDTIPVAFGLAMFGFMLFLVAVVTILAFRAYHGFAVVFAVISFVPALLNWHYYREAPMDCQLWISGSLVLMFIFVIGHLVLWVIVPSLQTSEGPRHRSD